MVDKQPAGAAQVQMYPQAATCYEEVLMHLPASIATYVQVRAAAAAARMLTVRVSLHSCSASAWCSSTCGT